MATGSNSNPDAYSVDKKKILDYLKSQKTGASVLDLADAGIVSYEVGCLCLTELELDEIIVQKTSPLWEVK